MKPRLIRDLQDLPAGFRMSDMTSRPRESAVLMADPTYFSVAYAINPHMRDESGALKVVSPEMAFEEWSHLAQAFESDGLELRILAPEPGLPDLVFSANQSLAFVDVEGRPKFLSSSMRTAERSPEVKIVAEFHRRFGLEEVFLPHAAGESFEGAGDLLLVPGRRFCLAGCGPRTSRSVLERLPEVLEMPVLLLELAGENFYHLDTCVCPLDDQRVLAHLEALTGPSQDLVMSVFDLVLEPAPEEAEMRLACNAVVLPSGTILVEEGAKKTRALLEMQGFRCRSLGTGEFLKSGGSLFCMKLLLP